MILPWTFAIWARTTHTHTRARSCSCSCSCSCFYIRIRIRSCTHIRIRHGKQVITQQALTPPQPRIVCVCVCVCMGKDLHRLSGTRLWAAINLGVYWVWTLQVDSPRSTVHGPQSTVDWFCPQHFIMQSVLSIYFWAIIYLPYAIVHSAIMSSRFDSITLREYPAIWLNWLLASDSSQINVSD